MQLERLGQLPTDCEYRIQRRHGFLEHHRYAVASDVAHLGGVHGRPLSELSIGEGKFFQPDFDGILAGAPVLNFTDTQTAYVWIADHKGKIETAITQLARGTRRPKAPFDQITLVKEP